MRLGQQVINFIQELKVPEGPRAGKRIALAKFQRDWLQGAFADGVLVGILTVARGNGKSTLTAGVGLAELFGIVSKQDRRQILIAARTRDQAAIVFNYCVGIIEQMDEADQDRIKIRRGAKLEIELDGDHILRCISAEPRNALGTSPTLVVMDERAFWPDDKGDDLEAALMSGLGKRSGRCLMISTSAANDQHSFSQWIDSPPEGTFVQEHRPAPGLPADDVDSLMEANPGADKGIGSSPDWLKAQAQRAIARGGSALSSFRLFNRNERVSGESRDVLLSVDEWLGCEVTELPARQGDCVCGVDLGGSASMSAAVFYWPESGRLEAVGAFPTTPTLHDRGMRDGVRDRYVQMEQRGELVTLGEAVVPADLFLSQILKHLDGEVPVCLTADRYRQAEFEDAMRNAGLRVPVVYRGMGFKDGAEDVERFRQAAFDGHISVEASLLLRSAMSDAVTVADVSNNQKLAKARATGRIDAAAAAILAIAEGKRRTAVPAGEFAMPLWA